MDKRFFITVNRMAKTLAVIIALALIPPLIPAAGPVATGGAAYAAGMVPEIVIEKLFSEPSDSIPVRFLVTDESGNTVNLSSVSISISKSGVSSETLAILNEQDDLTNGIITLSHGARVSIQGGDPGGNVYIVTELTPSGYADPEISGDFLSKGSDSARTKSLAFETPVVTFTNTKLPTGSLTVGKELAVAYADWGVNSDTEYHISVEELDDSGNPAGLVFVRDTAGAADYYRVGSVDAGGPYYYNGLICGAGDLVTEIPFTETRPVMLSNLRLGGRYEVREIEEDGSHYTTTYTGNGLPLMDGATITVTNTYVHGTGNLTIKKELYGEYSDLGVDESTIFKATVADLHGRPGPGGEPNILRFKNTPESNGSYFCVGNEIDGFSGEYQSAYITEIPFTAGKPVVLTNLWASEYDVRESAPTPAPVATTYDGDPVELPTDGNAVVIIANTYVKPAVKSDGSEDPPTDPTKDNDPETKDPDDEDTPAEESDADESANDPSDSDNPTETANMTRYAPPGGSDPYIPPNPTLPGHSIEPGDDGRYIEFDEEGVPLGEWRWEEVIEEWIFDEYPPLGSLPRTGADNLPGLLIILACLSVAGPVLIQKRTSAYHAKHNK